MTRSACLNSIYELAKKDERVVFIGSDLAPNTLSDFKRDFPNRYFMEGVQEQNIIGIAAGLAMEGFIPYVNTIATFITRRCYEQISVDCCLHNLPVRLIGNGGGLVYAPLGPTHIAIDDIALMRTIPNMTVICCADNERMKAFMPTTLEDLSPMYIRLGKDSDPIVDVKNGYDKNCPISIIATGIMCDKARKTVLEYGYDSNIFHVKTIKPFPEDLIDRIKYSKIIITMEEGIINGGLGSAVLESLSDKNIQIPVLRFGLPDSFPHHYGEQEDLLETYGLTPQKMAMRIKKFYDSL